MLARLVRVGKGTTSKLLITLCYLTDLFLDFPLLVWLLITRTTQKKGCLTTNACGWTPFNHT